MLNSIQKLNKTDWSLIAVWCLVQMGLLATFGANTSGEAEKFIKEAESLRSNYIYSSKFLFYNAYVSVVAIIKIPFVIVLLQTILSGLACIQLRKVAVFFGARTGNLTVFLFVSCYPIQIWNSSLYTESIFISLLILLCSVIVHQKSKGLVGLLGLILLFTRPTFVLFLPAFVWLYFKLNSISKKYMLPFLLIIPLALYNRITHFPEFFSFFISDQVICELVMEHQYSWRELIVQKITLYFGMVRPHYSFGHNTYLLIYSLVYIPFALMLAKKNYSFKMFFALLLVVHLLFVSVTCVNWNNRFMATFLPFVFILANVGVASLNLKRKKKLDSSKG